LHWLAFASRIHNYSCVSVTTQSSAPPLDFIASLSHIGAAVDAYVLSELRKAKLHGLRRGHSFVIQRVILGPATASEMAESLGVTQQAVSKTVGELVSLGYLRQSVDRNDRRRRPLTLTARGRRAVEVSSSARAALEDRIREAAGQRRLASAKAVAAITAEVLGIAEQLHTRMVQPPLDRS
jgi:DNA-binding MarR family transcriptional regulator